MASLLTGPDYSWIATVDGMGVSPVHVSNVLRSHGIGAIVAGTRAYGVSVAPEDVEQAARIIGADAHDMPYHYLSVIDEQTVGLPEVKQWENIVANVKVNSIDRNPRLRKDQNLRTLAKEALINVARVFERSPDDLYVSVITAFRMDYMSDDLTIRSGYVAEVKVALLTEPRRTATACGWVWDDGERVEFRTMFGDL